MKLNNFAVSVMNFFVKLSFWLVTVFSVFCAVATLLDGKMEAFFAVVLFWVVATLIWAVLSSGWLVLSKIAAHLESIDSKTQRISFGFDTGEGDSKTVGESGIDPYSQV